MLHTTFAKAKEQGACIESYRKMAKAVGGITKYGKNTPIGLDKVFEVCGLQDTIWAFRCTIEPEYDNYDRDLNRIKELIADGFSEYEVYEREEEESCVTRETPSINIMIEFACRCAEHTLHFYEDKYPNDNRPRRAIEAARFCIIDKSPAAESAADSAESAAWSATESARPARSATESARSVAWSAEWSAAWAARSAARSAAWAARSVAWSAEWSARSAAESAEWAARSARTAAKSARSVAWSAEWSARSARTAAKSARSVRSARSAAESAEIEWQSKTLLELLK